MVDIDDDHLGGAARRTAGFDGTRGPVADAQKAHQPGGTAAARQPLALAAQFREIRAGPRAVFEDSRLAHPQIHDPALVDEIVGDALDKAGMRLRVLIGARRLGQLAGAVVDIPMALRRPVDAIGPVQPGIEPLRRVRRPHLARQHQPDLIVKGGGVGFAVEIAALPAPIGPGPGHAVKDLAGIGLAAKPGVFGQCGERRFVGTAAPQPRWHAVLGDGFERRRDAGLAEIFLREDVGGDLAPLGRHLDALGLEHDRAVGIADLAGCGAKPYRRIWIPTRTRKAPLDLHSSPPTTVASMATSSDNT